jgi:hypothetical protein
VYQQPVSSIALAFRRIHRWALICSWVLGISIGANTVIWALVAFTEVRFQALPSQESPGAVVTTDDVRPMAIGSTKPAAETADQQIPLGTTTLSPWDGRLRAISKAVVSIGTVAGLMLAPLMTLGLILAMSLSIMRCERAATAVFYAFVFWVASIPLSHVLSTVEFDGLLLTYDSLASRVSSFQSGQASVTIFFARHLMLPIAAVLLLVLMAMRYRDGLECGMYSREVAEYEDSIDREASNVSATSLRGAGRMATAFGHVAPGDGQTPGGDGMSSATKVSPGTQPRRLI